jgi:multiple sugar transport system substrate-binding protein
MKRPLLAVLLAVLLTVSACADGDEARYEGGSGRIRFQVAGEAEEITVYRTLIAALKEDHPELDVQLVEIANKDDHIQKLATSFAVGDAPDVFLVNFREYSQFVVRDALEPVESHLAGMGIDPDDYYPEPLEAFTYDGVLQCMPQNVSSLVVYYNTTLFEEAGLPRPSSEWTWAEFRSYARTLTAGDVKGVGIDPNVIRIAPFVWSNGGEVVDDLSSPTRFTLDTPEAREALRFIVDLVREDGVVPTEEEVAGQKLETRFVTGKLGMYLSSRRAVPVFREQFDLEWDVAALPVAKEPAGILHSDAYCISKNSGDVDAALDLVSFATTREGQTITALAGRTVPSLRSVAESGAFLNPVHPPEHSEVFLETIPILRRTPVIPTWPEIEDFAEEVFRRAFYEEGYSIDEALADLDRLTRPLFAEGAP